MTALLDPKEAPEPGAFASAEVDKLLLSWRQMPFYADLGASPDEAAALIAASIVDDIRLSGHDLRAGLTAVGKRLTELAGVLGRAPLTEDDIAAAMDAIPAPAQEPSRPV